MAIVGLVVAAVSSTFHRNFLGATYGSGGQLASVTEVVGIVVSISGISLLVAGLIRSAGREHEPPHIAEPTQEEIDAFLASLQPPGDA